MTYTIARNTIPAVVLAACAFAHQPEMSPPPPLPPGETRGETAPRADRRPGDERRRPGERTGDRPGDRWEAAARDPKLLKEMLERMLEQNNRIEKRLADAKAKLDDGAPPAEVIGMLREARAGTMAEQFFWNWRERQRDDQGAQGPMFEKQPGGPGGGFDPERRDELMQFIREVRPEFGAKLDQWQKEEPKAFRAVIGHLFMQAVDTFRERDRDQQLFELRKNDLRASILVVEKATEVRATQASSKGQPENAELNKSKAELRELMGEGYDARVRVREYEADRLAKRLEETRARIQETKDVREQLLDRAVQQVLERQRVSPQPGDEPQKVPGGPGSRRPEPAPRPH